ncbi:MAG TPA: hypothetical protein VHU40_17615 [Polyangia bacterium]|nr:hypothetical protein [Polyangia bacterium]
MAKLSQLLLFDPDPRGLAETSSAFKREKEACDVVTCGNVPLATALLKTSPASLVLVMLRAPERVGLAFIEATTTAPESKHLPCVAVGPANLREQALQAGAVCYLSSPGMPRDILDACRVVAASVVPGSPPTADGEATLRLADIGGIYYLVRAMAPTGRSCAVEMQRGQRRADLRFIDGNLSSVQVGSLAGLAALHRCLLWDDADVRMKFGNVVRRGGQLSMKDEEVIEECDRFQRDFAHEVRELGIARTVFRAKPGGGHPPPANEMLPLLRLFDGTRDLGQVLDESPFRVFDTLTITKQFASAGAIVRETPLPLIRQGTNPPWSGPAALEPWFQRLPPRPPATPPKGTGIPTAVKPPMVNAPINTRPSSPFIKVAEPAPTGHRRPSDSAVPRARTITQREHPASRTPTGGLRLKVKEKATTSSSPGVARGEIQVRPHLTKKNERESATERERENERAGDRSPAKSAPPAAPSVLVDMDSLPPARSMAATIPAPLTAQKRPASPSPSVIIAPLTPPPVPADIASMKTPPPVARPEAIPARKKNPNSSSFNAVEADFFEREADLYKGEAAETFDDLDGAGAPPRPRTTRKR